MDKMAAIHSLELLEGLTEEQLSSLVTFTNVVECKKGEKLFKVGQSASQVYFLLSYNFV